MTIRTQPQTQPQTQPVGIDVCSGPSLTRAERLAQEAGRFAPRPTTQAAEPPPLAQAAE